MHSIDSQSDGVFVLAVYFLHFMILAPILNFIQQTSCTKNREIMKAQKYTAALLMTMFIGLPVTFGQRPVRAESKERREQTVERKKTDQKSAIQRSTRVENTQRNQRPDAVRHRAEPSKQQSRARTSTPANRKPTSVQRTQSRTGDRSAQVRKREPLNHQRTAEPPRYTQRQRSVKSGSQAAVRRTAPETLRESHRTTHDRARVKNNKYSSKRYYSGHHYHRVHPARHVKVHHHHNTHVHHYRVLYYPAYRDIYWTRAMYRNYRVWYPNYHWSYNYGYRIQTISAFDAKYNLGEVAMVYGRVSGTWYNRETDDYLLFFAGEYPYHHFTVVLPGRIARRFSWRPERYFLGEHMTVTGLITTYDGVPEVIVKNRRQVGIY